MPRRVLGAFVLLVSVAWAQPEEKPSVGYAYQVLFEGGQTAIQLDVSTHFHGAGKNGGEGSLEAVVMPSTRMLTAVGGVKNDG